eukprot:352124_1
MSDGSQVTSGMPNRSPSESFSFTGKTPNISTSTNSVRLTTEEEEQRRTMLAMANLQGSIVRQDKVNGDKKSAVVVTPEKPAVVGTPGAAGIMKNENGSYTFAGEEDGSYSFEDGSCSFVPPQGAETIKFYGYRPGFETYPTEPAHQLVVYNLSDEVDVDTIYEYLKVDEVPITCVQRIPGGPGQLGIAVVTFQDAAQREITYTSWLSRKGKNPKIVVQPRNLRALGGLLGSTESAMEKWLTARYVAEHPTQKVTEDNDLKSEALVYRIEQEEAQQKQLMACGVGAEAFALRMQNDEQKKYWDKKDAEVAKGLEAGTLLSETAAKAIKENQLMTRMMILQGTPADGLVDGMPGWVYTNTINDAAGTSPAPSPSPSPSPTGPKLLPIGTKSATRNITPSVSTSVRPLKITDTRDVVTRPGSSPNKSGANNSGANKSGTTPSGNSVTTPASDAVAANRKAVAANMTGKFAQMAATPAPTRPGSAANKSASTAIATGTAPTAMPTAISTQRFAIAQQKEKHPVQGGSIPATISQKTPSNTKKSLAPEGGNTPVATGEGATDETAAKALLATMMLSAAAVAAGGATAPPSTGPVPVASPENPEKAPENPEKKNTISKEALNEALNAISREAPETSEKTPVCSSPLKTFDENVHNQILATEIQNVEARTRGEEAWKAHMDTLSEIRAQQLMAQDVDVFNQNTGSKVTQEEYVSHYVSELEAFQAVPILNALTSPKPDVEVPKAGEDNKAGEDKDKKDKNQIEQVPKTGEEPKTGDNVSDATVLKTMPSTAGTSTASTTQLPITATREVLSKAGTSTASTSRLQIAPTRAVFDRPTTAANKSDSTNTSANTSTNTSANTSVSKTPASGAKTPSTSDASSRASVEAIAKNRETIAKGCTGKFLAMANVKHIPRPTK